MSSDLLSLVLELYNPLYLFPIIGVLFTALLVFTFGFKSSTQPSEEVFDALNDKHHKTYHRLPEPVKKKKQNHNKVTTAKTDLKSEPNGHINDGSVKASDKKTTPKKSSVESKPSVKTATNTNVENKTVSKRVAKNKRSDDSLKRDEVEDKDSGEWVELISRKERKNRKQKEEQLLVESKNKSNKSDKKPEKSPKKESKKGKTEKSVDLNAVTNAETKTKEKPIKAEEVKSEEKFDKQEIAVNGEEQVSEELDIYELAKEQRVGKKWQKRNQKRGSESETALKSESLAASDATNLDVRDKLTAAIVANYETNDQNKADSTSTANNKKKKEKNKKKTNANQTPTPTVNNENSDRINSVAVISSESSVNAIDIPNEIKPSEEDEFKSVSKKRRARRE
ncbi:unnamed protein product [Oppiella nova]|uniref:Uncharacterized protein n=1 Tax=Oppiella nova TaxID=334625 RepID=A0A7R9LIV3_9ACAR|nr:unnamed protein product [Oppiella nova]CAG2163973.1 unnamed protein product [Oppiella nova]